ncbi:MAG: hypothetical protein ACK5Q2_10900, partial [Bacteroidota bacterium]
MADEPGQIGAGAVKGGRGPPAGAVNRTVSTIEQFDNGSVAVTIIVKSEPPNNRDGIGLVAFVLFCHGTLDGFQLYVKLVPASGSAPMVTTAP